MVSIPQAKGWIADTQAALANPTTPLQELQGLLNTATLIPIDLTAHKVEVEAKVKAAADWVERVRQAVPRKRTRRGTDGEMLELSKLESLVKVRTHAVFPHPVVVVPVPVPVAVLRGAAPDSCSRHFGATDTQDAAHVGGPGNELDELSTVVETSHDWINRVREALAGATDATVEELKVLLNEAKDIPVLMDERVLLQAEVNARDWALRCRKLLDGRCRVDVMRAHLKELDQIKATLPASKRKVRKRTSPAAAAADTAAWLPFCTIAAPVLDACGEVVLVICRASVCLRHVRRTWACAVWRTGSKARSEPWASA